MCWCGKSKQKKKPTSVVAVQKPLQRPSVISGKIPKSTVAFSATDYDAKPFNNQSLFGQTQKVNAIAQGRMDRDSRYYEQAINSKQSKLLVPKQLLSYQLDYMGGVSSTPVVNTFHYESILSHFFVDNDPGKYLQMPQSRHTFKSSRQGESQMYDIGSQQQYQIVRDSYRNTKKSDIYSLGGDKVY